MSLTISEYGGYYDLYPITGLTIKAANHETGEEQVYTTDHQGKVSLGTYSYDEFFNLAGGTLQFLFEEAGYYEVSLEATAVNRTDYYGYEINDSIYREIFVRE